MRTISTDENEQSQKLANLSVNGTGGVYDFLAWALDAVRDPGGNIVCRATLPGPELQSAGGGLRATQSLRRRRGRSGRIAYVFRTLPEDFEYKQ